MKLKKGGFLSTLLDKLGASLLGNILVGEGMNRTGEGIVKAGYENKKVRKTTAKIKIFFNAASSFN